MPKSANTPVPNVPNVPNVPDPREKPTSTAPTPKDAAKELTEAAKKSPKRIMAIPSGLIGIVMT